MAKKVIETKKRQKNNMINENFDCLKCAKKNTEAKIKEIKIPNFLLVNILFHSSFELLK